MANILLRKINMKIKLRKGDWEKIGHESGWIKTAQGRMDRGSEEMYPTTGKTTNSRKMDADVLIQTDHILRMQKMLHAIDLAIPCLEDWTNTTSHGETNLRDKNALNALKESIKGVEHLRGHGMP